MPQSALSKLQEILHRLFRLDESIDLDFGIYRLINLKRNHLSKYLEEQLPQKVADILKQSKQDVIDKRTDQLNTARENVIKTLGTNAIDADGKLKKAFEDTPDGERYLQAQQDALNLKTAEELQNEIYDHLASFFSRYECGGGDIVPRRRHSIRNRYAVPYNGEETLLHWANRDQYYIKTAAYNPSIAFKLGDQRFRFQITEVHDIPRDNNKDTSRFLLPQIDKIRTDNNADIVIPFTFRELDTEQRKSYRNLANSENGTGDKVKVGILSEAFEKLQKAARKDSNLLPLLGASDGYEGPAFIRHANRFVRRNTADFFIHRNLRKFLTEELDFYLKNETLNAEELSQLGGFAVSSRMTVFRAIRELGADIIDALSEWEELQKSLWEKKKFVLQTEYCATIGHIPNADKAGLFKEIAACDKQWDEWKQLGMDADAPASLFSGKTTRAKRIAWLREHLSLPIDTANFPPEFKDRLLEQFTDIDDATDGVLIHGENWQALNLMQETYHGRIKCVYIDPPYNAPASEVLYVNDFKHSSWLSLMYGRLLAGSALMSTDGVMSVAIDDYEFVRLAMLLEQSLPNYESYVAIVKHHGAGGAGTNLSRVHEYNLFLVPKGQDILKGKERVGEETRTFTRTGTAKSNFRTGRPNSFYALLVDPKTSMVVDVEKPPCIGYLYPKEDTTSGLIRVYPIIGDQSERVWRRSYENVFPLIQAGELRRNGQSIVHEIDHEGSREPLYSIWASARFNAGTHGTNLLRDIFGKADVFAYSKSMNTVQVAIDSVTYNSGDCLILDYFAGSGTTAHAVMNLNRKDGRRRKFILAEVGDYFNTVILPRIKKIIYAPEWYEGKPCHKAAPDTENFKRGPRLVKYQRIESYEDALGNIQFKTDGLELNNFTPRYELELTSRDCPTRLIDTGLEKPFTYSLELVMGSTEDGQPTRAETADLPETFAWLTGFRVKTRRVLMDGDRRYLVQHGTLKDRATTVIWRDIADWQEKDYGRDCEFIEQNKLTEGAERVLLNGSTTLQHAESLNPLFGNAMFPKTTTP